MRSVVHVGVLIGVTTALHACAAQPAVPAVLSAPDEVARTALNDAVAQALGNRGITLAPDALTASSRLLIEPFRARDASGRLLQGRETRTPESFQLRKRGAVCVLTHERTGNQYPLRAVECEAEAPR